MKITSWTEPRDVCDLCLSRTSEAKMNYGVTVMDTMLALISCDHNI